MGIRRAWCARHFEDGSQFKDDTSLTFLTLQELLLKLNGVCYIRRKRMKEIINTVKAKINDTSLAKINNKAEGVEVVLSGEVGTWDVSARKMPSNRK